MIAAAAGQLVSLHSTFGAGTPHREPQRPMPHVAVESFPCGLAVRWLHDARGSTRLTLIIHASAPDVADRSTEHGHSIARIPSTARDIASCLAFAAVVAGTARADTNALGGAVRIVRIAVDEGIPPFFGVEVQRARPDSFGVIAVEPCFSSTSATLASVDAFVEAVAGHPGLEVKGAASLAVDRAVGGVTPDVAAAFVAVQRRQPAVVPGVLRADCREMIGVALSAARAALADPTRDESGGCE